MPTRLRFEISAAWARAKAPQQPPAIGLRRHTHGANARSDWLLKLHERVVTAAGGLAVASLAVEYGAGVRGDSVVWGALTYLLVMVFALSMAAGLLGPGRAGRLWRVGWPVAVLVAALALQSLVVARYGADDPVTTHRLMDLLRLSVVARVGLAVLAGRRMWRVCEPFVLGAMLGRPIRSLLFAYAMLIAVGTVLLRLPAATLHHSLGWGDASFMAVSAATLTGMSVVSVADTLTRGGQIVLIALVQLSAIVIMSFGAAFWLSLCGESASNPERSDATGGRSHGDVTRLKHLNTIIVAVTFGLELLGTALLFVRLPVGEFSTYTRIFVAGFHAVSAFCNAGFSVYARGMAPFYADWDISMLIASLGFVGGLGFLVWAYGVDAARRRATAQVLRSQAGVVLAGSLGLVTIGTVAFSLAGMPVLEAMFHSVNTRSAGFDTVSSSTITGGAAAASAVFMFLGGAPGSAAGGVKITTGVVLLAAVFAPRARRGAAVRAATAVVIFSVFAIGAGVVLLFIAEATPLSARVLEAVSAFGTVGLSFGQTPSLTTPGRAVVMAAAFE